MLRDAQVTILDLRQKLATANQTLHATQAELSAERQAKSSVDDGVMAVPEVATPIDREGELPVVRRPVGRPRKATIVEMVQTVITPPVSRDDAVPLNVDAAVPTIRRPVGRPRKIVVVEPTSTLITPPKQVQVISRTVRKKTAKPVQKVSNRGTDDQEPVQWWVEGWSNEAG
jgi:hypothetical protein